MLNSNVGAIHNMITNQHSRTFNLNFRLLASREVIVTRLKLLLGLPSRSEIKLLLCTHMCVRVCIYIYI